jgi:hypothetical protein
MMVKTTLLAGLGLVLLLATAGTGRAEPGRTTIRSTASDVSGQERRPPRLRVYPGGRRLLYRDCDFKLVQQYRPSGTVIVPWQRCWWVRG